MPSGDPTIHCVFMKIIISFKVYLESFPIQKLFHFLSFPSLSLHKCRKSLSKTCLMSLKVMGQTMLTIIHVLKQVQVSRGINKNFARNLLLVLRTDVVFYFSTTNVYKKGASPCAGTCRYSCTRSKKNVLKFLKPYGPVCVDR